MHAVQDGHTVRLHLAGSVGVGNAQALRAFALEIADRHQDIEVMCGEVEHFDVAILQILLALRQDLLLHDKHLRLTDVPAGIARYLRVAGLEVLLSAPVPV